MVPSAWLGVALAVGTLSPTGGGGDRPFCLLIRGTSTAAARPNLTQYSLQGQFMLTLPVGAAGVRGKWQIYRMADRAGDNPVALTGEAGTFESDVPAGTTDPVPYRFEQKDHTLIPVPPVRGDRYFVLFSYTVGRGPTKMVATAVQLVEQ